MAGGVRSQIGETSGHMLQTSLDWKSRFMRWLRGLGPSVGVLRGQRRRLVNFSMAGGASVVVALAALAMLALNTRGLGSADFGVFLALQAYVALCSTIFATESWQSLCRLGCGKSEGEQPTDLRRLCGQALALDGLAAVAAFVLALGGLYLAAALTGLDPAHRDLAAIHALSLLAGITGAARGFFRLRDRFAVLAANQVWNALFGVALSAVLFWREAGLAQYVYSFTVLAIAYKLQLLGHLLWHLRREPRGGRRYRFGQIARMSLGVSILSGLVNARRNVAMLAASAVLGPAATGLFGAALKCTTPLARLGEMIKQVLFVDTIRAFRDTHVPPHQLRHRLRKLRAAALGLLAISAIGTGLVALVAERALGLLLGPAFVAAAPVLVLLLLAEGVQLAGTLFNPVLQARGRTAMLTLITAAALGGFAIAALIWGEGLGASGIAALMLAAFGLAYCAQFALVFASRKAAAAVPDDLDKGGQG